MSYTTWSLVYGEQPSTAKWNILGTNDAHFYGFLGDNLAWQSWTPTLTSLTLGSGTLDCYYTRVGKTVHGRFLFVLGAGSAVGTTPYFSLPVTPATTTNGRIVGMAMLEDASAGSYVGFFFIESADTNAYIYAYTASTNYASTASLTSTVPMAWASGDWIGGNFSYEAA